MAVVRVKEIGMKRARDSLGRFSGSINTIPMEVLLAEAPRMQEEARMNTPVDTGDLRAGTTVRVERKSATKVELIAQSTSVHRGYDYSNIQHDSPELNHPNGGRAFYLRDAFNAGVQRINKKLAEKVKP